MPASDRDTPPDLELLVPIAVVIAGGCEPCARRMVARALDGGAPPRHVRKTLGLVAHMQRQDCYAQSIGAAGIARMERPLAAARRTLQDR